MEYFPQWMIDQRRWMVRGKGGSKQPFSAHETRPIEYEPPEGEEDPSPDYWRWRWSDPCIWATYEQAKSYAERHPDTVDGLCFILHPGNDSQTKYLIICIDYDGAIKDGEVDPEAAKIIDAVGSYTELSSNDGLHQFMIVESDQFYNTRPTYLDGRQRKAGDGRDGEFTIEVKCAAQIAVTGKVYGGYDTLESIPMSFLKNQPFFEFKKRQTEDAFKWASMPQGIDPDASTVEQLRSELQNWTECIEGQGGDVPFFAAACHIMRHGITGDVADELLQEVPQTPSFSAKERAHRLRCAHQHTLLDDTFGTMGIENEFPVMETKEEPPNLDFGFEPVDLAELMANEDLKLEFIVDGCFVNNQSLFIGGQQKCFKTGVAADFAISMATGTKFLGKFQAKELKRSAFFTAEIGQAKAKFLGLSICRAKEIEDFPTGWVDIIDQIPPFQIDKQGNPVNNKAINGLKRYFDWAKPDIAIFDPLYLAMCGSAVGDMYEIGGVLRHIVEVCQQFEIWPVFCHHARKDSTKEGLPMELNDFYGSGVGAFARQWILLSHAEPFNNGKATMFARIGGSAAGDQGLWRLTIDEGQPDDIMERTWDVSIIPNDEAEVVSEEKVLEVLRNFDRLTKVKEISGILGISEHAIEGVLRQMFFANKVEMRDNKYCLLETLL